MADAEGSAAPAGEEFGQDHAKAALKIQTRARVKNDQNKVEKLKEQGNLPGQVRARKIQEWGTEVFNKFDANGDGKLSKKELASALKGLPKTKPKKVLPGTKYQSVDDMVAALDSDGDGLIDLEEWLINLKDCPGLAAALTENVEVATGPVAAEEIVAFKAEDFTDDHKAAALKIQTMQRAKAQRAEVQKRKAEGSLPGQQSARQVAEWGMAIFQQMDTNGDGRISKKELAAVLAKLPKTKPKKTVGSAKFQSLEEMMQSLDSDGDGSLELAEWLDNLKNCPGLAAALSEHVSGPQGEKVSAEAIAAFNLDDFDPDQRKAIVKIQSLQRGRQTRRIMSENSREGARAIFVERQMMNEAHMDASALARASQSSHHEQETSAQLNVEVAQKAHEVAQRLKVEEEMAATKMQSLYRGFRDRKQVRTVREEAEGTQRGRVAAELARRAEIEKTNIDRQTSFTAGGVQRSYISSTRRTTTGGSGRRVPGTSDSNPKQILAPTLVDKKAIMTSVQRKACVRLEEVIKKWATSYARSVELAPGADKTGALEFVALFSKPSKEEPIAWPVVRVFLTMTNTFERDLVPAVTYHLEGEKMMFDTRTDIGRRFKESWLDRIVMDKRALRADMALRRKN